MRKARLVLAVMLFAVTAVAQNRGFDRDPVGQDSGLAEPKKENKAAEPGETSADPLTARIQAMDLRQRAAQLMLVTLSGAPGVNSKDLEFLSKYTPGGVLLPPQVTPSNAQDYVARLRSMPTDAKTRIPLLIGTNLYDLPKGRNHPNEAFFQLPSPLAVAAACDPDSTKRLGDILARQLNAIGLNLNLGPSLELAPSLPEVRGTIGCFGGDPRFCAEAGGTILKALLDSGIVAVPMGFPGGGANRRAKGPAVLVTAGQLLEQRDLLPYKRAIELGVPVMHVSNTFVPTIESANIPASISPAVIRDLLRGKLGFKGVVIAGPMDTNDVAIVMDPTKAAVASLKAGADLILWNEAGSRVVKTVEEIVRATNAGELSQETLNAAVRRVLEMKEEQGLGTREPPEAHGAEKLGKDKDVAETIYAIERKSLTLVQNRNNVLPLNKKDSIPVGITGEVGVEELYAAMQEHIKQVIQQPIVTARHSGRIMDFEIARLTRSRGVKTAVCIFTDNGETATKKELVQALQAQDTRVVVVLLGYPSSLEALSDADAILLAYCSPTAYAQTMKAVADVLVGQGPIGVLETVRDLQMKVGQEEVFNPLDVVHAPAGRLPVTVGERYAAGTFAPYDPTYSLKKALWDFGDGSKVKDVVARHSYAAPGRYPITLTVVDKKGETTSRTFYAVVE